MIDVVDGPKGKNDWGSIDWENDDIFWDETTDRRKFQCSDIVFTRGKHQGQLLSEIDDTFYLKFVLDKNPEDYLINYTFKKRLKELK